MMINQNETHSRTIAQLGSAMIFPALIGVVLVSGLMAIGCQKTALRPDDDRSQFDRYDQSRSHRAQPFLEDEFGRRTPNLAERLLDRND